MLYFFCLRPYGNAHLLLFCDADRIRTMNIFIARQGQTLGPFDLDTINAKLQGGEFTANDLAWGEGMTDWVSLAQLPGTHQVGSGQLGSGQLPSTGHMPPDAGEDESEQVPPIRSSSGYATPTVAAVSASPAAPAPPSTDSVPLISPWLQAIGAAFLLFLLWTGKYFFALLGIPVFLVLLLVSWNQPERMRFVFRQHTNKVMVRLGLGAALALCFAITNLASKAPAQSASSAPVSEDLDATGSVASGAMERRIENAEAKAARAEAAQKNAQRDKSQLEQKLRDEQAQRKQDERVARQREVQQREANERVARQRATRQGATRQGVATSTGRTTEGSRETAASNVSVVSLKGIGRREVGVVDNVGYAIVRIERAGQIGQAPLAVQADGVFAVVRVMAVNTGRKTHDINPLVMRLFDQQGREFEVATEALSALALTGDASAKLGFTSAQPDTPKAFSLVFDVPADAAGLRLKIPSGTFSLDPAAIIKAP